jgi:hypothetical protein
MGEGRLTVLEASWVGGFGEEADVSLPFAVGSRVTRYRLEKRAGAGGMAVVSSDTGQFCLAQPARLTPRMAGSDEQGWMRLASECVPSR